ncbi:MAG: S41 family peptidase [Candidatus Hydrogenedentota bacterium]
MFRSASLVLLLFVLPAAHAEETTNEASFRELRTFVEAYNLIAEKFADTSRLQPKTLLRGALNGMLESLGDPHTRALSAWYGEDLSGEFSGVGIHIGMEQGRLIVVSAIEGSPAWRGGVEAGDMIMAVDGKSADTWTLDDAVTNLRGPVGSGVTLDVKRAGRNEVIRLPLLRDLIRIRSVRHALHGNIGYIRISQFNERTAEQLDEALAALGQKKVRALILDLRDNPGGVLSSATDVANRFIGDGVLVSVVSRDPRQTRIYNASPGVAATRLPLAVLINKGSASAAEIVCGAIQDHKRGVIIGTKTYGKGSVQSVETLPDRSKIALTTARYVTPAGRFLHGIGLQPDSGMLVDVPEPTDTELKILQALTETSILREFAGKKTEYSEADIDQLARLAEAAGLDVPRTLLERRYIAELSRRNENKIFLVPALDPALKKAIDVLNAAERLADHSASIR